MNWSKRVFAATVTTAVVVVGAGGLVPAQAETTWLDELVGDCPDLYALGVQGTTETSPDAPVKADTGVLGTIMSPMLAQAREIGASVDRAYVPYPGSFGGITPGGSDWLWAVFAIMLLSALGMIAYSFTVSHTLL